MLLELLVCEMLEVRIVAWTKSLASESAAAKNVMPDLPLMASVNFFCEVGQ